MNRHERRRFERIEKKGITIEELLMVAAKSKLEGIETTTQGLLCSMVMALHDQWGWGHTRITRLLEQIDDQFDSVSKGYITIDDMKKTVLEEVGVDFK